MKNLIPGSALDAAAKIEGAFAWCDSPQGHDYWEAVVANLMELERQPDDEVREFFTEGG